MKYKIDGITNGLSGASRRNGKRAKRTLGPRNDGYNNASRTASHARRLVAAKDALAEASYMKGGC